MVVYLISGFVIANTFFADSDVHDDLKVWFKVSEILALELIGFKIGNELKINLLKENPQFVTFVLLLEVVGAFIVVFTIIYLIWGNLLLSILLGGLSSTVPAAIVEVLRK